MNNSKAREDLTFRNVELHSLGRREYGTLILTKHHFVFRYYPGAKRTQARPSRSLNNTPSTTPRKPDPADTPNQNANARDPGSSQTHEKAASAAGNDARTADRSQDGRSKQQQKEMWMPYPLINHCVLRPSHSIAYYNSHPQSAERHHENREEDGELFPPTYGTASYTRSSSDSARLGPYSSPVRSSSPGVTNMGNAATVETGKQPAIRIRLKDFRMMALHFHANSPGVLPDDTAREVFFALRTRCCIEDVKELHAFHFSPPKEEKATVLNAYDARGEYNRMGVGEKVSVGPGTAWRISDINKDYSYSPTYPHVLCVPKTVSDNMLKYGGSFRSRSRIPCLSYLHSNGGSVTRSSQPMVGVQSKRNPQDERLVSAIFSSHTPPLDASVEVLPNGESGNDPSEPAAVMDDMAKISISQSDTALNDKVEEKQAPPRPRVYGSTRRNLIIDARPKINALANRATGGGIEDVANYKGNSDIPIERVFLNVANIHVMRASLEKIVESLANSDYINVKPDQEALRKSGWLGHIAGILDGAEMIARVVGLGGSHVLIHCSDGWDRTAQLSALVQIMLDPHSRTLDGFISLVQKEFLSFGHKFRDRDGIEGSEKWFEIANERVAPSRSRESNASDSTSFNALSAKAMSGAKSWFEKNRGAIFRQQNSSHDNVSDQPSSRSSSPPPNPLIHSPPNAAAKEEKAHRMSEKEVSPVFHQFLDTVYQLIYQNPNAFQFNEHFLCRLFYHVYSCQYGEFLFNTEKERNEYKSQTGSVWSHFLSRRQDFTNASFAPQNDDPLLFPKRSGVEREIEVRWWNRLFKREDSEMNVPRALMKTDLPMSTTDTMSGPSSADVSLKSKASAEAHTATANVDLKATQSTPNLPGMKEGRSASTPAKDAIKHNVLDSTATLPSEEPNNPTGPVPATSDAPLTAASVRTEDLVKGQNGDPLGVAVSVPEKRQRSLDFAAFASQNAFQER